MGPLWICDLCCERGRECVWPPSAAGCAKMGDVFVVESGSESKWMPLEDPRWKALEYLSMQIVDQTRVLERSTRALEGIASIAMASLNVARERAAAAARGPGRVDRGVGPEELAPVPTAEKGALFESEALDD